MKSVLSLPLVATLFGSLFVGMPGVKADDTLIDLSFESTEPKNEPTTEPFQMGIVNHTLESISVTDTNKLEVIKDAPGFPGKALHFTKGSAEPRTPAAVLVNKPGGLLSSGKVRFSWEAATDSFTASEKFPGFEALLTFVLMDRVGKPFFNLYYLVGKDQTSGVISSGDKKFGAWNMGEKQTFEVTVDLDKKTALIKIDGSEVSEEITLPDFDGLRVVQFTDGAGLAYYGGLFTATVGNFKMVQL